MTGVRIGAVRSLLFKDLRRSVILAAGLLVAAAVVCARLAVLNAAYRIDKASLERERQLFAGALASRGERLLRELESVAATESARRRIRASFDPEWANDPSVCDCYRSSITISS